MADLIPKKMPRLFAVQELDALKKTGARGALSKEVDEALWQAKYVIEAAQFDQSRKNFEDQIAAARVYLERAEQLMHEWRGLRS